MRSQLKNKENQLKELEKLRSANNALRKFNENLCHNVKELEQKLEKSNSNNSSQLIVTDHLLTIKGYHVRMAILWFVLIAISVFTTLYKLLKYVYSKVTQLFWEPEI